MKNSTKMNNFKLFVFVSGLLNVFALFADGTSRLEIYSQGLEQEAQAVAAPEVAEQVNVVVVEPVQPYYYHGRMIEYLDAFRDKEKTGRFYQRSDYQGFAAGSQQRFVQACRDYWNNIGSYNVVRNLAHAGACYSIDSLRLRSYDIASTELDKLEMPITQAQGVEIKNLIRTFIRKNLSAGYRAFMPDLRAHDTRIEAFAISKMNERRLSLECRLAMIQNYINTTEIFGTSLLQADFRPEQYKLIEAITQRVFRQAKLAKEAEVTIENLNPVCVVS